MKNWKRTLAILLCLLMTLTMLAGCKKEEKQDDPETDDGTFNYSTGIADDGYWEGIKASDIVTLPADYTNHTVAKSELEPTEADIQNEIDSLQASYVEYIDTANVAPKMGDQVSIDFAGRLADGTTVDGMTSTSASTIILGSGSMIPGFEEAIAESGAVAGDVFDINVTFPDPYSNNTDLSGKDAVFTITLHSVQVETLPEINDAWVAENMTDDGLKTLDELKTKIHDELYHVNEILYAEDYLMENSTFGELPESMITYQEDANYYYYWLQAENYAEYYSAYGYDAQTWFYYLTYCQDKDELTELYADSYTDAVKYFLVCQAVAEQQNLKVTSDDIATYFIEEMGYSDYTDFIDFYGKGYVSCVVLDEKAINFVIDHFNVQ